MSCRPLIPNILVDMWFQNKNLINNTCKYFDLLGLNFRKQARSAFRTGLEMSEVIVRNCALKTTCLQSGKTAAIQLYRKCGFKEVGLLESRAMDCGYLLASSRNRGHVYVASQGPFARPAAHRAFMSTDSVRRRRTLCWFSWPLREIWWGKPILYRSRAIYVTQLCKSKAELRHSRASC